MCCLLLPHSTYFIRQFLVLVLFVGCCFGEIMCIWDSCVYQKDVLCFLIHKSYVRSIKSYSFVRKYAAIPVQLEIFILHYPGRCVLVIWTFIVNQFSRFCQFLMYNFGESIMSLYMLGSCQLLTAAVMCWIVSDSFPHLLHNSSVSGCFKIYFLLVWLGPVLLLKSPLFRWTNPRLSSICSTLFCLHIVDRVHTDGGHARLCGTIVSWLCYILYLWGVHLHLLLLLFNAFTPYCRMSCPRSPAKSWRCKLSLVLYWCNVPYIFYSL